MTDQTADLREQYAHAIRNRVRIRFGDTVLRLARQGRPIKMTMEEAEAAADAVLAIRDAARQAAGQTTTTEAVEQCRGSGLVSDDKDDPNADAYECPECNGTGTAVEQPAEAQPADRATILREVAAMFEAEVNDCPAVAGCPPCDVRSAFAARLRRMADGTES